MKKESYAVLAIILIFIILIGYLAYPSGYNYFVKLHNSKIDYSCNADSDCTVKIVGSGICQSPKQICVNMDSIEGKEEYFKNKVVCLAIEMPPNSCKCEDDKCVSYRCSGKECYLLN